MNTNRYWLAGFALFVWVTVILGRSFALGQHGLAFTPDRILAILITFVALTTFGVTVGRIWDSEHKDDE